MTPLFWSEEVTTTTNIDLTQQALPFNRYCDVVPRLNVDLRQPEPNYKVQKIPLISAPVSCPCNSVRRVIVGMLGYRECSCSVELRQ